MRPHPSGPCGALQRDLRSEMLRRLDSKLKGEHNMRGIGFDENLTSKIEIGMLTDMRGVWLRVFTQYLFHKDPSSSSSSLDLKMLMGIG